MGVPALFRFLQRKYPKIILPVEEEGPDPNSLRRDPTTGETMIDITTPNPNGVELDNLYLDMNGIVHPCTHPEGRPAPETEEDMMVEVFRYTDRVVNMVRPRKLLFMAIDGVAPRAKMNQQRSRRFRSARDAEEAAQELKEAIIAYEALGHTVSDDIKNKKSWDSNAITPGTPFMSLLAASLRYWVSQKMNSDPGWKDLEVIISDASVPGEGEHKIMDWIRRQRVAPGYDPNTQHVIYGLDADLIMLALATHEPNFRVLREDVFADSKKAGCRSCGRPGHVAAQCTIAMKYNFDSLKNAHQPAVDASENAVAGTSLSVDKKPFIFLDVTILREYLEVALNVPNQSFPFDLERAIDDWIFLIFFVGNDFLPHLPSLDIRKGGIDTLLNIWKKEITRMDGYVTSHGHLNLARVQLILEGLGQQEAEIFKKHHEDDERQKQREAQQKMSRETRNITTVPVIAAAPNTQPGPTRTSLPSLPHGLPQKPTFDMFAKPESTAPVMSPTSATAETPASNGVATVGETNRDVVSNRAAIRMANMSAAEALKAELHGLMPLGRNAAKPDKKATAPAPVVAEPPAPVADTPVPETPHQVSDPVDTVMEEEPAPTPSEAVSFLEAAVGSPPGTTDVSIGETAPDMAVEDSPRGTKRKAEDIEEDAEGESMDESDEVAEDAPIVKKSKTEEHDSIKLWTPGYQQRYYKSKFEFEWADREARHKITSSYVEGLCWVLHYYYQGTPSWQWFYPSHYAPFAGDFDDVATLSIQFKIGQPFKPFEQLMAVFPPASRKHIPVPYQELMTDENSPIIDFYPLNFEIDMNGKTQAWQGIALLPFIDEQRLLDAMKPRTAQLSKDEIRRNTWGSSSLLVSDQHPLYNFLCELYSKRKKAGAHTIDIRQSNGLAGMVVADSAHVPGATYESPLASIGLPDISNNRSISVLYYFPKQVTPHRSVLLPGAQPPPRRLDRSDIEFVRAGREYNPNHRGRGGGRDNSFSNTSALGRGSSSGDRNSRSDGHYGAGGYQDQSWESRHSNGRGGGYSDRNGSYGYGNRGSQGAYSGYGSNSGRSPYGSNYGSYGTPPPPQGRGGYPSYSSHRGSTPTYGQGRGRGNGRGGYY